MPAVTGVLRQPVVGSALPPGKHCTLLQSAQICPPFKSAHTASLGMDLHPATVHTL